MSLLGKSKARDIHIAEQAVQDRPLRLQVEPLHVQGRGRWSPSGPGCGVPRGLADKHFGVQRVAFLDDDVDAVEELVDGVLCQSSVNTRTGR